MNELDRTEQRKALDDFANAGAQPNQPMPHGHSLVRPTQGLSERVVGAQPVAIKRDLGDIKRDIKEIAAMAGPDWFYRFPVRTQGGGQDWIEGPSIKLANNVARIYGNNDNEIREVDVGDAWVFYARFTDIETGFSMERAYHQRKSQTSLKTKDRDRQIDISYQIGQSKAIRNCIVNALGVYCDFAFDEARNSIVEKIGKDLPGWIERTVVRLRALPVDIKRVERVVGRATKDWLAPDVAHVVALGQSVRDGMATIDEVFPPDEEVQTDQVSKPDRTNEPATNELSRTSATDQTATENARADTTTVQGNQQEESGTGSFSDPIAEATQRGRAAHASGMARRALPGEYRDRPAVAAAWQAGWDQADKAKAEESNK